MHPTIRRWSSLLVVLAFVAACSNSDGTTPDTTAAVSPTTLAPTTTAASTTEPPAIEATTTIVDEPTGYRAEIRRTSHGVAHIVADDLANAGFGQGYAYAQDRACTLIDQVIKVRGERSKWFGAGPAGSDNQEYVDSDFAYRHLGLHADADARWADQPDDIQSMIKGYVAGFNQELTDEGPNGWCEGEPWVQPITTTDLYAYIGDVLLYASTGILIEPIATAVPPAPVAPTDVSLATDASEPATTESAAGLASLVVDPSRLASNGWAIGKDRSDSGGGLLVANPHFPWEGDQRLWELHITIPGDLDVYGVALGGLPGVQIGFNRDIAWTHTVSDGRRFTLYELQLIAGRPTSYKYGDEEREMTAADYTVEVLQADGTTKPETRTLYNSHYGPMLNLPFGWSGDKAYTMRDGNIVVTRALQQFLAMDAATGMDEFQTAHETYTGVPWVNTIAVSSDGRAWYADTAITPYLSDETTAAWQSAVAAGGTAKLVNDNGATMLDGSDPANEWVVDPEAPAPGLLPYRLMPKLERRDYVFNANDSHWLANPDELLTGYPPMTGAEGTVQSARTRMNAAMLGEDGAGGADGKFSLVEAQESILSNRALTADVLVEALVADCGKSGPIDVDGTPVDIAPACAALTGWDGRFDTDSVGAIVWREFFNRFDRDAQAGVSNGLYEVPFDPALPATTPNTPTSDRSTWLPNLAKAVQLLNTAGIPVDAPLGDFQFDGRAGRGPALGGGWGDEGLANVIGCCARGGSSTAPDALNPTFSDDGAFATTPLGYPVTQGTSFLMAVQFTAVGPQAGAFLTYGQPDDPDDPRFRSQTELFGEKAWRTVTFDEADITADAEFSSMIVTGTR